jgi:hypothetical protein
MNVGKFKIPPSYRNRRLRFEMLFKIRQYGNTLAECIVWLHFVDTGGKLEAIESMVTHRRAKCLSHPVVVKFFNQKLNSNSVRLWIVVNMLLYMIFLVSLTTYTGLQTTGKADYPVKYPGATPSHK